MPDYPDFETVEAVFKHMKGTLAEREGNYDHPLDNFNRIADGWNWYLRGRLRKGQEITATDVSMMSDLMKTARFMFGHEAGQPTIDHVLDKIGYMICLIRAEAERLLRQARPSDWRFGDGGQFPTQGYPASTPAGTGQAVSRGGLSGNLVAPTYRPAEPDPVVPTTPLEVLDQSQAAADQDVGFVDPLTPEWKQMLMLAQETGDAIREQGQVKWSRHQVEPSPEAPHLPFHVQGSQRQG